MPTVVIIHAAEDTLPARALAEKLRPVQVSVVLEKQGAELQAALRNAQVALPMWSPRSVSQPALLDDVAAARGKTKVVHVTMQSAAVPEPFRGEANVNLTGWRGEDAFPTWVELIQMVAERAGVAPPPPPPPRPPSGFFQPGRQDAPQSAPEPQKPARAAQSPRPAPQPPRRAEPAPQAVRETAPAPMDEPRSGGGNLLLIGGGVVVAAALAVGGFFWFQSQSAQTAASAWEEVERNDPAALRAFIEGQPGAFREEAASALRELEERSFEAASDVDTIEAFEEFLASFPDSEHAIAARGRIAELEQAPQPPVATEDALPGDVAPGAEPPPGEPAPPATPPAPAAEPTPVDTGGGPAALTPPPSPDAAGAVPAPN